VDQARDDKLPETEFPDVAGVITKEVGGIDLVVIATQVDQVAKPVMSGICIELPRQERASHAS
jgi:hypothetical protein